MDINMKNVELFKKDGWVYIKTSEDPITNEKKGTKLLVDDGTKSLAQYQAEVRNLAVKNSWDRLDDLAMIIDFGLTFAGSQKMTLKEFLMDFNTNATKYAIPAAMYGLNNINKEEFGEVALI